MFRRAKEKVLQATGFTGKDFQATSNLRNETMLKEASEFARHVKHCQSAITSMKSACDTMLVTTKSTMTVPLPHVFEDTAAAAGSAAKEITSVSGNNFATDAFLKIGQDSHASLESDVLVPIKRWIDIFSTMSTRNKEVEALRLEVDSRRHTVIDLTNQIEKLKAKLADGANGKVESQLDEVVKTLQHKEGKLALTVQNFQEKEQALHADLSALIKDSVWLHHYLATALKVQGEALTAASAQLGSETRPVNELLIASIDLGAQATDASPPMLGAVATP